MKSRLFNLRIHQQELVDELNWEKERLEELHLKLKLASSSNKSNLVTSLNSTIKIAEEYISELEKGLVEVDYKIISLQK